MKQSNALFASLLCLFIGISGANAQSGIITTIGGNTTAGYSGDGGPATSAELNNPLGVAVDGSGNVYVGDVANQAVRKITPGGVISTIAGNGTAGFGGDGGPATAAEFDRPYNVAVDGSGNVYIVDFNNHRIRKVTPGGVISTFAGNGSMAYSGDGGPATAAGVEYPNTVAVDASGNVYIGDYINSVIRKVNTSGIISTIAGTGTAGFSGDGGAATAAQMDQPWGIAIDASGNVYFTDYNNYRVRKISTSGIISTVAGTGTSGYSGDGGAATAATLSRSYGLSADAGGNVYFADAGNNRVRKIDNSGIISTVVGNGTQGYSGDGGAPTAAELYFPTDAIITSSGNIYIADDGNNCVRKINLVSMSVGCVSASNELNVYPNPNKGTFTITLPHAEDNTSITVMDIFGKIVKEVIANNQTQIEINLNSLPKNVYFIKVVAGTKSYREKVTIW